MDSKLHGIPPNLPQVNVMGRIVQNLQDAGEPPEGSSCHAALVDMMGCKSLYNEEPQNLAEYSYEKVKVLHSELRPRNLKDVLPKHAASILDRFSTMIEKSNQQIADDGPCGIRPYWDPRLKSDPVELVGLLLVWPIRD